VARGRSDTGEVTASLRTWSGTRAESVTETDIAIFLKTDTDVGIEKTENRRKKIPRKTKIRFLLMTIY